MTAVEGIIARLQTSERVLISTHEKPDGDALGSVLALSRIMRENGSKTGIIAPASIPPRYESFIEQGETLKSVDAADWDVLVVLDCGDLSRAEESALAVAGSLPVINIDHHATNTEFGELNWVDTAYCSAGEMIYTMASSAGWKIPPEAAEALWVAIVTDTGRFSYQNTSPQALRAAAELVSMGVEVSRVNHTIYESVTLKSLRLRSRALASLDLRENGEVALVELSLQDFEDTGCGTEDTEDIVNIPRSVEGVRVALLLYELPDAGSCSRTKVSFRTVEPYDAAAFCGTFGGGGHQRAAGCTLEGDLKQAKSKVLDSVSKYWFLDT